MLQSYTGFKYQSKKMKRRFTELLSVCLVVIMLSGCASYYVEQGDTQYQAYGYAKAAKFYEKAYAKNPKADIAIKLADCYRNMNNYANAEKYFAKGIKDAKELDLIVKSNYGKVLMSVGKYDEAKEQFKQYLTEKPGDFAAQLLLNSCNDLGQFYKDTTRYSTKDAGVKGLINAYSPAFYKDGIVVVGEVAAKREAKQNPGTLNSYQDLYFMTKDKDGKLGKPEPMKGSINDEFHQGPASFNKAGTIAYYSSNIFPKVKASEKYEKDYNVQIRVDSLVGGEWRRATDFPHNNQDYSVEHPSISQDGKFLYFSSNMPGGQGGYDIYMCAKENGTWGNPVNLGPPINTSVDEKFPSVFDGRLYFASNGHKNLGGYDVYLCKGENGNWKAPINLNYPLNTKADDFGLILNPDGKTGYFSSNRSGSDRIFEFVMNPPIIYAKGKISAEGGPLAGTTIIFENKNTGEIDSMQTDSNGEYNYKLTEESDYVITARKTGYLKKTTEISTKGREENDPIVSDFELMKIEIEKPVVLDLGVVFFDYDKYKLRKEAFSVLDGVVKMLIDNPEIRIELSAHTDSRGTDKYNQKLSDRRANAVYNYMISKKIDKVKIDKKRLEKVGYGETKIVNECVDGTPCSDEKHQQNRRTEMKILK
jgi:outer membrane protein OmpA-like peptidoglycan-associated protein/tetratricopeptide (TPR) repeat protein